MKPLLIGITGRDMQGAALVADHYQREYGFEVVTIRAPFEDALASLLGAPVSQIRSQATAGEDIFPEIPPAGGSFRESNPTIYSTLMSMRFGFAHHQHEQFSAMLLKRRLDLLGQFRDMPAMVVVPDVLLRGEATFIRSIGGAIFHMRNAFMDKGSHPDHLDATIQALPADHTIENNGTNADLFLRADNLLARLQGLNGSAQYRAGGV